MGGGRCNIRGKGFWRRFGVSFKGPGLVNPMGCHPQASMPLCRLYWVVAKEVKLSYHNKETIIILI